MTANALTRQAIYDLLTAETAPGGRLDTVTVLRTSPEKYADLHDTRGMFRCVYLTDTQASMQILAHCGGGQVVYSEVADHVIMVQADDETDAGTMGKVDTEAADLLTDVIDLLTPQELGIDLSMTHLDTLVAVVTSWDYATGALVSGSVDTGHAAAYAVTLNVTATWKSG